MRWTESLKGDVMNDCNASRSSRALRLTAWLFAAMAFASLAVQASAQSYPNRPIKMIVPFTPGTSMDIVARAVGEKIDQRLGQPVVVDNRPGATGIIGSDAVAKADPDGYTLLVTSNNIVVGPLLRKTIPFDPLKDFAPITVTSYSALVLVASNKSGIKSVAEMIAQAKANPGKLNYSSPGVGTTQHLSMEALKNVMNVNMVHVPYRGSAGATTDLLSGQVDLGFVPIDIANPHYKANAFKVLAVGSPQRHPIMPDVPTLHESGIPGVESNPWHAVAAPKGTPRAIIDKLNSEIRAILDLPDVREKLEGFGLKIQTGTPEEMQALMERDMAKSADLIRRNNISID
jgi:tripartite-type tricarboxylate transporter receptor subunit TctC